MGDALVVRRAGAFAAAAREVAAIRPGGVGYDSQKSDEWQLAYMRMVEKACVAMSGATGSWVEGFNDGSCNFVGDGDVGRVGVRVAEVDEPVTGDCGTIHDCGSHGRGVGCGFDQSDSVNLGDSNEVTGGRVGHGVLDPPVVAASCASQACEGKYQTCATKTEFNRMRRKVRKDRLKRTKKEGQQLPKVVGLGQFEGGTAVCSQSAVPEWRRRSEVRQGFFSDCSRDVQKELKETRAKLLIEENKRRLAQEQAKLRALDQTSPEYLAREYLRVMSLAGKMRELKDEKVGKWATVVAESMVHTVAASAPSSVPSLESVGFGNSALKSSSGSELSERKTLFEAEKLCLDNHYQSLDFYQPADYSNALGRLKEDFADVVFESSVAERVKEKVSVEKFISNSELEGVTKERAFNAYRSEFQDVIQLCGTD